MLNNNTQQENVETTEEQVDATNIKDSLITRAKALYDDTMDIPAVRKTANAVAIFAILVGASYVGSKLSNG